MADADQLEGQAKTKADNGDNQGAGRDYSDAAKLRSDAKDYKQAASDYDDASAQFGKQGDALAEAQAYAAAAQEWINFADSFDPDIKRAKRKALIAEALAKRYEKQSDEKKNEGKSAEFDKKAADEHDKAATAFGVLADLEASAERALHNAFVSYSHALSAAQSRVQVLKDMHQDATSAEASVDQIIVQGLIVALEAMAADRQRKEALKEKDDATTAANRERKEKSQDF